MLNNQQQLAFDKILALDTNYFLTWYAGTGKSYLVHSIIDECKQLWIEIAVASTTWSSAVDIWWTTYHSLFWVFGMYTDDMEIHGLKRNFSEIELIIIDEISMMWPDMLDLIDKKLRFNTWLDLPFGGIKLLIVWDEKQLGPIYQDTDSNKNIIKLLKDKYWVLEFTSAKIYSTFEKIELTEIMRSKDEKFISLLNRVREWDNTPIADFKKERFDNPDSVHIAFRNDWVNAYNNEKLDSIATSEYVYRWYYFWDFKTTDCTSPEVLALKVGARVMITKNLNELWLTNGDIGTITALTDTNIVFLSDRLNCESDIKIETFYKQDYSGKESHDKNKILLDFEKKSIFVDRYKFNLEKELFEEIKSEFKLYPIVTWKFVQFPMKLAYAMSVHKSQWKTFEKMTLVLGRFDKSNIRQLYVGLSRWQSYENTYVKHI
jgi:hypothetical protein